MDRLWAHTWPCSQILSEFVASNRALFADSTVLELGAGVGAVPSMTAWASGAKQLIVTDKDAQVLERTRANFFKNFPDLPEKSPEQVGERSVVFQALNWSEDLAIVLDNLKRVENIDFLLGSDIFFDPSEFRPLIRTLMALFGRFPHAELYLAYQIRCSTWTIEDLLEANHLSCSLIRCTQSTRDQSILLLKIHKSKQKQQLPSSFEVMATEKKRIFAGIEGLNGTEKTADELASWVRSVVKKEVPREAGVELPLVPLGLGLSGAEDAETNAKFQYYLSTQHADLAEAFFLTSDSVASVAAAFEGNGVVLIAGTGSACRLVTTTGKVLSAGGWGHLIGDGGGAFWIAMKAIRGVFEAEDGFSSFTHLAGGDHVPREDEVAAVKEALFEHFQITSKEGIFPLLYNPDQFNKSRIASFCRRLAEVAESGDEFAKSIFEDAGKMLVAHIMAVKEKLLKEEVKEGREGEEKTLPVLVVGSVFKSWKLLKPGFCHAQRQIPCKSGATAASSHVLKLSLYHLDDSAAIGAAILAAPSTLAGIPRRRRLFDELSFEF